MQQYVYISCSIYLVMLITFLVYRLDINITDYFHLVNLMVVDVWEEDVFLAALSKCKGRLYSESSNSLLRYLS